MRIFLWHVHGSWTTTFVQGKHEYFVPVLPDRPPDGLGRARTWEWPSSVVEVSLEEAGSLDVDVLVLQRPSELHHLARRWLRRVPGRDVPAIYLEHNCPELPVTSTDHVAKDRKDVVVVHVTHFNDLFWDTGVTRRRVIEHGVVDPGLRYSGDLPRAAVVVNEPLRRGRAVGQDLYDDFRRTIPLDLFGMATEPLGGVDLPQAAMFDEAARRRVYLHPVRWTSLGLSLIEAMQLGMPVIALGTTEVVDAVPPGAGVVSNRLDVLHAALRRLCEEPEEAAEMGRIARRSALGRFGLARFLSDWDAVLEEVTA
ncbi:MAG TPA: glycosyltransferase [Acidimicrobiales bacterium]|jgi:hypothetical protein